VSLVGGTQLRVSVNPKTTGTYDLVVQTGGGSTTKVNALSFDPIPVWSTASGLGNVYYGNVFSITLSTTDAATYTATSSLPPNTTLVSNGVLQGNITSQSSATYNFTVQATDAQLQDALRSFSLNYVGFIGVITQGLLVDTTTDGGNWYAVKYMYNTTTAMASSQNHTTSNYYINISRIQSLMAYASDILFREDSSSTLAKCASTSAFNTVKSNVLNSRAWFYNTHGASTLSGWLVGVNGGNIPDAQLDYCNNYSNTTLQNADTSETSLAYRIFDSCGNGNGSHTLLNNRQRLRADSYDTNKVHSVWLKIV